jgi:hypothetical protein
MARAIKCILPIIALLVHGAAGTAIAGTSAYVTSGTLTKTVDQCLKDLKSTGEKNGFTVAQETLFDKNGMAGDFHADKAGAPLHFTGRCNSVSKTWGIAVSGINNDETFSQYQKFFNLLP